MTRKKIWSAALAAVVAVAAVAVWTLAAFAGPSGRGVASTEEKQMTHVKAAAPSAQESRRWLRHPPPSLLQT